MKTVRVASLICGAALSLLSGCATERIHREGLDAIDAGRYEEGLQRLEAAVKAEPRNATYQLDLKARRENVVRNLIDVADQARAAGKLEVADTTFRRALAIEPANDRARHGVEGVQADRRHAELLTAAQADLARGALPEADAKLRSVLAEDPGFRAAREMRAKIDIARGPITSTPQLRTRDNRPVSLQFRDVSTKMVFEVLSNQTGINFIFDKEVKSDSKTTIFVQNVPIEQAIELILGQNQLARQVLSDNMVLIYPNTPAKQHEYQDQVVKTFYLSNADPKQALTLLKTVLDVRTLFIDERSSILVMRDTPEVLRMAEKLIASLDLPEPEVMLEVEVLEITRSRLQQLGIAYPQSATLSANPLTVADDLRLRDVGRQNSSSISVTPINVTVDALKQTGVTNILATPRLRARSREKARILIGSRVPVITTTQTPATSGPVTTSSVQYVDVGVTVEVEPIVHLDGDVAIKMNLEVSSILKQVEVNDTLAYEIGTRTANTLLQLKDGETQILAGLINDQDQRNSDHIPGLGDIPVIGRLFGSRRTNTEKTEIVMSITPRIIRARSRPASETTEFWYGTESNIRLGPLASTPATVSIGATASPAKEASPVRADNDAGTPATFRLNGPIAARLNNEFSVSLEMSGSAPLSAVQAQLSFDPAVLELIEATSVASPGVAQAPPVEISVSGGVIRVQATGRPDAPITGKGSLVALRMRPRIPSSGTSVTVTEISTTGMDGSARVNEAPLPLTVAVR